MSHFWFSIHEKESCGCVNIVFPGNIHDVLMETVVVLTFDPWSKHLGTYSDVVVVDDVVGTGMKKLPKLVSRRVSDAMP